MAKSILFGLVRKIIERLSSVAFEEIVSIWGVKGEFENLKNTFSTIQAVLQDAEEQQDKNHQVEDWLMRLTDAVYDADDLVSYFSTEELRRKVMGGDEMAKKVCIFFSSSNQLAFRFKMTRKIKVIRGRLDAIASDRSKFQLVERPLRKRVVTRERDQTHSFKPDEKVFGRDAEKETIIDMLLNIDEEDQNVSFISIVGIGGLGKTTLAQYVYNDERVKTYFELQMWVCVSDVFNVKEIAEKIIESATRTKPGKLEMEQVQITLHEKLNQKKYLLVLDDVWNENREKWSELEGLLIGGSKGSKVVITTRSRLVAKITRTISSSYFLKGLSKDESWSLFKQMAFEKGQVTIDSELEEIGMGILEKCCGVPLAIKTIGSVLYFEETKEWSKFKDQELTNVTREENDILPVLKLSYDNLPSHLKCCFAYCSLFPKDFEIPKSILIQLWIAQGFIRSSDETRQLEDVANKYCMDLYWRSFFEEAEKDDFGNIISFKMHDLIHDIAQAVSKIECTYFDFNAKVVDEKVRHLSFPSFMVFEDGLSSLVKAKKIRTFLKFGYGPPQEESSLKKLISNFRCLRVLDLSCLNFVTVPNSINKLTYLKYLDLSNNNIEVLPNSFVKLLNLQNLKLSYCRKLKKLPRDIKKLISLKHLEIDGCESLTHVPCGIVQLTSLQTLILSRCEKLKELPRDIQKLVNLKHLEIDYYESLTHMSCGLWQLTSLQTLKLYGELKELPEGIQNLIHLKHLEIVSKDLAASSSRHHGGLNLISLPEGINNLTSLQSLQISNCPNLNSLPEGINNLTSLQNLEISNCHNLNSLPEGINNLTSLQRLQISECPNLTSLPEGINNLTSLQNLEISNCPNLTLLPEGINNLTSLQSLRISNCPNLTSLPEGIRKLTSLHTLRIFNCPHLKERCQEGIGEDWHKIAHIPKFGYDDI